jgi:hypothetical protein
VVAVSREF